MNKATTLFAFCSVAMTGCEQALDNPGDIPEGVVQTDEVACDYTSDSFNDDPNVGLQSTAAWSCVGGIRSLSANGVPDHAVGDFPNPNNPTAIGAVTVEVDMTLDPEVISDAGEAARTAGYALNGVKVESGTGGTCTDNGDCSAIGGTGQWRMEALGVAGFDFGTDDNHAHVQPTGSYHYHGVPDGLVDNLGSQGDVTLIGWAVDGFPMYARVGYSDPTDATSDVVIMQPSWTTTASAAADRPSIDVYALGAFTQDWEYVGGFGDLDECNGRFGVTPEFPEGIYHYYLTDSFPFGPRCVKGTSMTEEGGPDGPPPGGGPPA